MIQAENQANGGFPEPESYVDPLSDAARCEADIPNLTTLGVNAVRVYNVNPQSDHAGCMQAFDAAGIYVIADLALPLNGMLHSHACWNIADQLEQDQSTERHHPGTSACSNHTLLLSTLYEATITLPLSQSATK